VKSMGGLQLSHAQVCSGGFACVGVVLRTGGGGGGGGGGGWGGWGGGGAGARGGGGGGERGEWLEANEKVGLWSLC
ncbi:hypothetical protein, partial [Yersinia enterocolitica]|uniref:hypothetical protein n=1 Tax=Yersinia enterocolitica TaxID=630 RepID=UPI0020C340E0